jgi:hypothetical protein
VRQRRRLVVVAVRVARHLTVRRDAGQGAGRRVGRAPRHAAGHLESRVRTPICERDAHSSAPIHTGCEQDCNVDARQPDEIFYEIQMQRLTTTVAAELWGRRLTSAMHQWCSLDSSSSKNRNAGTHPSHGPSTV